MEKHPPLTYRPPRASSPFPDSPNPRAGFPFPRQRTTGTFSRLRSATISPRLLRPLIFLLILMVVMIWIGWGDSSGYSEYLEDDGPVGKWIPIHVPDVIVHPHFPGTARKATVSDLSFPSDDEEDMVFDSDGDEVDPDESLDPVPANPLALLEEDKEAAYDRLLWERLVRAGRRARLCGQAGSAHVSAERAAAREPERAAPDI